MSSPRSPRRGVRTSRVRIRGRAWSGASAPSQFRFDPVARPAYGLDEGRAQLSPETADEHLHRVRVPLEALRIDVLRQLALRNDAPAVMHEVGKDAEFVARQFHGSSVPCLL